MALHILILFSWFICSLLTIAICHHDGYPLRDLIESERLKIDEKFLLGLVLLPIIVLFFSTSLLLKFYKKLFKDEAKNE